MKIRAAILGMLLALPDMSWAAYDSIEVTDQENSRAAFVFSSAEATSNDPIRISAKGRKLTPANREHRTDLQRHWIKQHVREGQNLILREQALCKPRWAKAKGRCDRYVYADASGTEHEFYFYLDNWP
jgi:hypothetical protein